MKSTIEAKRDGVKKCKNSCTRSGSNIDNKFYFLSLESARPTEFGWKSNLNQSKEHLLFSITFIDWCTRKRIQYSLKIFAENGELASGIFFVGSSLWEVWLTLGIGFVIILGSLCGLLCCRTIGLDWIRLSLLGSSSLILLIFSSFCHF